MGQAQSIASNSGTMLVCSYKSPIERLGDWLGVPVYIMFIIWLILVCILSVSDKKRGRVDLRGTHRTYIIN